MGSNLNVSGVSTFGGLINASADIKTDAIRRYSDSSTTTKILLNDEVLKFHAGHASDEVVKIELDQARPLIYKGYTSDLSAGHAFVIDGYSDDFTIDEELLSEYDAGVFS